MKMNSTIVVRRPLSLDAGLKELVDLNKAGQSSEHGPIIIKKCIDVDDEVITRVKSSNSSDLRRQFLPKHTSVKSSDKREDDNPVSETAGFPRREVANLPLLHQSNRLQDKSDLHFGYKDSGTIRRPYGGEDSFNPLIVQAFQKTNSYSEKGRDYLSPRSSVCSNRLSSPFSEMDLPRPTKGGDGNISPDLVGMDENHYISPFPPVENDEIDKHRLLNEELEKNNKSKTSPIVHPSYLKRLKLERKALEEKQKEIRLAKKKMAMEKQRFQARAKAREVRNDLFLLEPPPPPPPKPKMVDTKPIKTILGFRYSQAIEEYYRGQLKHFGSYNLALLSDVDIDTSDEIINGWFVRPMGANVLNLHARTLPSCNPVEIRLRRKQARMQNRERSSARSLLSIHRSLSRGSVASHVLLRSHDSLTKLKTIEEGHDLRHSEHPVRPSSDRNLERIDSDNVERSESLSRPKGSPLMHTHEEESYSISPRSSIKAISLRLPGIVAEEDC